MTTLTPAQKAWATRKANQSASVQAIRSGAPIDGFAPSKKPAGWVGVQTCGWCLTGDCRDCKVSTTYYDKTWFCQCACRKEVAA